MIEILLSKSVANPYQIRCKSHFLPICFPSHKRRQSGLEANLKRRTSEGKVNEKWGD